MKKLIAITCIILLCSTTVVYAIDTPDFYPPFIDEIGEHATQVIKDAIDKLKSYLQQSKEYQEYLNNPSVPDDRPIQGEDLTILSRSANVYYDDSRNTILMTNPNYGNVFAGSGMAQAYDGFRGLQFDYGFYTYGDSRVQTVTTYKSNVVTDGQRIDSVIGTYDFHAFNSGFEYNGYNFGVIPWNRAGSSITAYVTVRTGANDVPCHIYTTKNCELVGTAPEVLTANTQYIFQFEFSRITEDNGAVYGVIPYNEEYGVRNCGQYSITFGSGGGTVPTVPIVPIITPPQLPDYVVNPPDITLPDLPDIYMNYNHDYNIYQQIINYINYTNQCNYDFTNLPQHIVNIGTFRDDVELLEFPFQVASDLISTAYDNYSNVIELTVPQVQIFGLEFQEKTYTYNPREHIPTFFIDIGSSFLLFFFGYEIVCALYDKSRRLFA